MLTFQEETYEEFTADGMQLMIDHWEDVALNKDTIDLQPDWLRYKEMYDQGIAHVVTARTETNKLVGYAVLLITHNAHHKQVKLAEGDGYFLQHEYRRGSAGRRLLQAVEDMAKRLGATQFYQKVKLYKDVGVLFERMGYKAIERVYVKDLV